MSKIDFPSNSCLIKLEIWKHSSSVNKNSSSNKWENAVRCSYDDSNMKSIEDNADQPEILVPIRLDMEIDGYKLRDCFCWNKNGQG